MTLLISVIIVLLLAASLLLFVPWKGESALSRNQMNRALYQHRLQELAGDDALESETQREQMVSDLQRNLLDDIPEQDNASRAAPLNRWVLIPGMLVLVIVSVAAYYKVGASSRVVEWQQVAGETPQLLERVMNPKAQPLSVADLQRLALGLRTRLQDDPQNREGWSILGRIGMVLDNGGLASQAFSRAYHLAPENPDVKLDYAEILTRIGDPQEQTLASHMLRALRHREPHNPRVLSLLAFSAYQQQQYSEAISAWQALLAQIPQDDPRRTVIEKSIEKARVDAGNDKASLGVTITLSPQARAALPAQGVIFVSVTDGKSPVPVAVKKLPLGHFPITVTLNDSDAMMPERLLSSLQQGVVTVHLSASGTATLQPGDWFGRAKTADVSGSGPIAVEVMQQQR